MRAVNALLTQLDKLKERRNVMVLTTSNITEAIDVAFVDRADLKQYIGLPCLDARIKILTSCVEELARVGVLSADDRSVDEIARAADGLSGRSLRKLPFLAYGEWLRTGGDYLAALLSTTREFVQATDIVDKK